MAKELAPGFVFYVKEWRSSRPVSRMTFAERGMYVEMLLEQWENLTLPDCPAACAEIIGGTVEEWTAAWPVLRRNFVEVKATQKDHIGTPIPAPDPSRRIKNLRLEVQRAVTHKRSREAQKSARKRWGKIGAPQPTGKKPLEASPSQCDRNANALPTHPVAYASQCFPDPVPDPDPDPGAVPDPDPSTAATTTPPPGPPQADPPKAEVKPPPLPSGRDVKRPLPDFERLTIWPWHTQRIAQILGDHAQAFNILGWLKALDRAERAVLDYANPTEFFDNYLRPALLAEAKRRGLPLSSRVSSPSAVGSQPPAHCTHMPKCATAADHTRRELAERRANPTPVRRLTVAK